MPLGVWPISPCGFDRFIPLDRGTMNFAEADHVMTNMPGMLKALGRMMTDLGAKPQIETFDAGDLLCLRRGPSVVCQAVGEGWRFGQPRAG